MSLAVSTSLITTAGLPERERLPFWQQTVYEPIGADLQPISRRPFFGEIAATRIKEFSFAHLRCRGHRCSWSYADPESGRLGGQVGVTLSLRGKIRSTQDGRETEIEPGDLRIVDTTRPLLATMDDELEVLSVLIPRETWVRRIGPTEQITARAIPSSTYVGGLVFNFFRQLIPGIGKAEPETADCLLETSLAMLNTLASSVSPEVCRSSGRISLLCRAKTLIEENLHDPGLNPEKIARALRISERYLRDLFHEQGTTVCNWMWDRRVETCRQRLSDPLRAAQTISEVAFGCGFSNFAHFSVRFRAAFSMSPSEFRRERVAGKSA